MTRPTATRLRQSSDAAGSAPNHGHRPELFELRFQQATRQLGNTHRFKESRLQLAQLLTVQSERKRFSAS